MKLKKLELFYEERVKGIILRARARWYEHGERSSKYFLNLEKRNHVKKHIRKLTVNNSLTTDPCTILSAEQKRFYKDLYKSRSKDAEKDGAIDDFPSKLRIPKLSENQKQQCEGRITVQECEAILKRFQEINLLATMAFPMNFITKYWTLISKPFLECINESFEKGEMSNTQKQAVITLIEKKGKDRCFIENWRPISLLNVDAKIMSKVIATRIKNVLPNIIHHNQSGYVKDRYIGETVRSIYDVMDFTDRENISGPLIFINFQKAFDSLEWDFFFKCLQCFNFGQDFIHWVKVFYQNIRSCVINNCTFSDYFNLERGVRQGDPLSPYLFILAVETLAISIRSNVLIKGITIGNEETKLLQYADDTTAVLSDTNSAQAVFDSLDVFEYLSGLKVNHSKTEGLWIGSLKYNDIKPFGMKWPDEPIKALGAFFTYDQNLIYEKNFKDKVFKIKKLINFWSSRSLPLRKSDGY